MIGVIPRTGWRFCTKRNQWSHSLVHRPSRLESFLPIHKRGGQHNSYSSGKIEMSMDETAKAFAILADKLKESEKEIEVEKKLEDITQRLGVISKSLDQLEQASAAELKESKLQFAMNYSDHIIRHYNRNQPPAGYCRIDTILVHDTLMSFRQNQGMWLPEAMDENDRKTYAEALFWYLGHRPIIQYNDEEQKYAIRYA